MDEPKPKEIPAKDTEEPKKPPHTLPNTAEVFDHRGDLTLTVGRNKVAFRVCSRSLARLSGVWDAMLYGPLAEGKTQHTSEKWVVAHPDDEPEGLRILLLGIHGRLTAFPPFLTQLTVFALLVICDKYDMVEFLKPFWHRWVQDLPSCSHPKDLIQQLWMAYKLGDPESYRSKLESFLSLLERIS
ncbi:uncharacterized protein B0T15DRAFT_216862 [Chaetomium strumarium]|uniref:BTB domain-containing protein n=1 Tax=Chaetomium strumarium TaxID=1170767 RepID=A0AAJ0GU73_9PEZI|nr:hypothetical protein B0T15DRAFT_216862 [Chaetomium strumarium]